MAKTRTDAPADTALTTDEFHDAASGIIASIETVIDGKRDAIDLTLTTLLAEGHLLIEDVPGVGKTMLARALAKSVDCSVNRIQYTPDLLPSDITGVSVYNQAELEFRFTPGPVFANIVIGDEINRASPKTQSALLETMQEGSVTTSGVIHILEQPFFVMATQNPLEQEGTYPLPEAQLDRFLFKVIVPYPSRADLNDIVLRTILKTPISPEPILNAARILELREILGKVVVADEVRDFAVRLVLATHPQSEFASDQVRQFVRWGASPRAAQALLKAARVRALASGRAHISFDDIRHFAINVLQHRVLLNYDGQAEEISVPELIREISKSLSEEAQRASA